MKIPFDVYLDREEKKMDLETERENNIFFNKCLRAINGEDAYRYFCNKTAEILDVERHYSWCGPVYAIVNYFFDNDMYREMSLEDWLYSDDGPVIFSLFDMKKIFPEFALVCINEHKIVETANEKYNLSLEIDEDYVWSLSFDWNSFTPIPVETVRQKIMEVL